MSSVAERKRLAIKVIVDACKLPNEGAGLFIYHNRICYSAEDGRSVVTGPVATPDQAYAVGMINIIMRANLS